MAQRGQGSCEYCSNYVYDEEYEYYCCDVAWTRMRWPAFSGEIQRAVRIFRWRTSIRLCGNRCKTVKTTGLAGGLFCPYKGLFPACARKAH